MRKLIASINMTLDGFCDHTAVIADDDIHQHYAELVRNAGTLLYGRTTYQLMESYWPDVVRNPTGIQSTDEFALAIDAVPKIVFSRTLKETGWKSATLATRSLEEEVAALRRSHAGAGADIFVGSPGLISAYTQLGLIDEYQLCVHPVIAGKGLPLFKNIREAMVLKLVKTKTFANSDSVVLYYQPVKKT